MSRPVETPIEHAQPETQAKPDRQKGLLHRLLRLTVLARLMQERTLTLVLSAVGALQVLLVQLGLPVWRCPFRALTGRPCPGCGMSRAFVHLLRGEWTQAVRLHPFAPLFLMAWAFC